jgi:hypothetical protein
VCRATAATATTSEWGRSPGAHGSVSHLYVFTLGGRDLRALTERALRQLMVSQIIRQSRAWGRDSTPADPRRRGRVNVCSTALMCGGVCRAERWRVVQAANKAASSWCACGVVEPVCEHSFVQCNFNFGRARSLRVAE